MPTSLANAGQIEVTIDGQATSIDAMDFDRAEWRALKAALGMSQVEILTALVTMDLDVIAGLVWLVRRREEPALELDDINLTLRDVLEPGVAKEVDADPPV